MDEFLNWANIEELQLTLLEGGVIVVHKHKMMDKILMRRWYKNFSSNCPAYKKLISLELMTRMYRLQIEGWDEKLKLQKYSLKKEKATKSDINHVAKIMQFITQNLHKPLTITEIGKNVGLHPNYAMNLFNKVMHIPLKKYITRMRLHRAHTLLLETERSAGRIAYDVVFGSVSRFYEVFKQEYKMPPNLYRKENFM